MSGYGNSYRGYSDLCGSRADERSREENRRTAEVSHWTRDDRRDNERYGSRRDSHDRLRSRSPVDDRRRGRHEVPSSYSRSDRNVNTTASRMDQAVVGVSKTQKQPIDKSNVPYSTPVNVPGLPTKKKDAKDKIGKISGTDRRLYAAIKIILSDWLNDQLRLYGKYDSARRLPEWEWHPTVLKAYRGKYSISSPPDVVFANKDAKRSSADLLEAKWNIPSKTVHAYWDQNGIIPLPLHVFKHNAQEDRLDEGHLAQSTIADESMENEEGSPVVDEPTPSHEVHPAHDDAPDPHVQLPGSTIANYIDLCALSEDEHGTEEQPDVRVGGVDETNSLAHVIWVQCVCCSQVVVHYERLYQHMHEDHPDQDWSTVTVRCAFCAYCTGSRDELTVHQTAEHPIRRFVPSWVRAENVWLGLPAIIQGVRTSEVERLAQWSKNESKTTDFHKVDTDNSRPSLLMICSRFSRTPSGKEVMQLTSTKHPRTKVLICDILLNDWRPTSVVSLIGRALSADRAFVTKPTGDEPSLRFFHALDDLVLNNGHQAYIVMHGTDGWASDVVEWVALASKYPSLEICLVFAMQPRAWPYDRTGFTQLYHGCL